MNRLYLVAMIIALLPGISCAQNTPVPNTATTQIVDGVPPPRTVYG